MLIGVIACCSRDYAIIGDFGSLSPMILFTTIYKTCAKYQNAFIYDPYHRILKDMFLIVCAQRQVL